jgi:hypothetical protein
LVWAAASALSANNATASKANRSNTLLNKLRSAKSIRQSSIAPMERTIAQSTNFSVIVAAKVERT